MEIRKLFAVLVAGMMGVATAMADSVTEKSTAYFSVPDNLVLIRLSLSTSTIDFGEITEDDFDRGYKEARSAQVVSIEANKDWTLTVAANAPEWSGPWAKPAGDLEFRVASATGKVTSSRGAFLGLDTTPAEVAKGRPGRNIRLTMDFRVLLDYASDVPGDYSLEFTYTLTAP